MTVPRLRFKEFSGEWEAKKLGNFIVERNEYPEDKLPIFSLTIENGVTPKTKRYERAFLVNDEENAYKVVLKDDFAYNPMNLRFGAIAKYSGNNAVVVSKYYNIFHCKNMVNTIFCELYFKSYNMIMFYNKMATGSLVEKKRVHFSEFIKFKIPFPSLSEQTKIANFLTTVDKKIAQLTQKDDLLARYKKGVMHQIFSQQLRFKDDDGREFPDWEDSKLADVATIVGGGTPDTTVKEYWNGDIQWFTPTELKTKYMSQSLRTITESGLKNSSAKILPVGTLLFSSRATVGDVSIALNKCTTNQGFQSFIVNNENRNEFVYYWILNNKNVFLEKASGSTFLEISKKEIVRLKIKIPSIPEQAKIANFLTAIDDKINHNLTQLNASKQYKQGLLQQLFV